MKNKLKKSEKIISELIKLDRNNVFSDFCWPWIWTWTNASEFYKKLIYSEKVIEYPKKKIIGRLLKNIAKIFYYKLVYPFSKDKTLFSFTSKSF